MKKLISILLILCLLSLVPFAAFASDALTVTGAGASLVVDDSDLLTSSEEAYLLELAQAITERQQCDVAVVTVDDLGYQDAQDYADDYFDYNGYGYGSARSGVMLVISMADRDWYVTTRGEAENAFSEYGIDVIMNKVLPDLSDGNYYVAFKTFLNGCDSVLNVYRGTASEQEIEQYTDIYDYPEYDPYNPYPDRGPGMSIPGSILISLLVGFVIAFIPMAVMKGQLKTVHKQSAAANYTRGNSMHLDVNRDIYLYSTTTSRVIETRTTSGGGGGGGHTHISSSGASHGGHGGKF